MFQVMGSAGKTITVYSVHKSGPRDEQTKFLVYDGGWVWVWAKRFRPTVEADRSSRPPSRDVQPQLSWS